MPTSFCSCWRWRSAFSPSAGRAARMVGYAFALLAALLKYYPIMLLVVLFRERLAVFVAVAMAVAGSLAGFWAAYHVEIVRGWANIPVGPYNTDLFAAKNLPFLIGTDGRRTRRPLPALERQSDGW